MDALKDIQSVVQISQVEDRLRNFRYDGSVCSVSGQSRIPHVVLISRKKFAYF